MSEQFETYTVKELAEIIGTVEQTIRKKIKKHRLLTSQEMINNRLTTILKLTSEQVEALTFEINANKSMQKMDTNHSQPDEPPESEQPKTQVVLWEQHEAGIKLILEQLHTVQQQQLFSKDETIKELKHEISELKTEQRRKICSAGQ